MRTSVLRAGRAQAFLLTVIINLRRCATTHVHDAQNCLKLSYLEGKARNFLSLRLRSAPRGCPSMPSASQARLCACYSLECANCFCKKFPNESADSSFGDVNSLKPSAALSLHVKRIKRYLYVPRARMSLGIQGLARFGLWLCLLSSTHTCF